VEVRERNVALPTGECAELGANAYRRHASVLRRLFSRSVLLLVDLLWDIEIGFDRLLHPRWVRKKEPWLTDLLWDQDQCKRLQGCLIVFAPVSGQVMSSLSVVSLWRQRFPDMPILLFTRSAGGLGAADTIGLEAVRATALSRRMARRVVAALSPKALVLVQICYTGMPANLIEAFSEHDLPVVVVNGTVTDKNLRKVGGWKHPQIVSAYSQIDTFCVRSELDASRLRSLGASAGRIKVTGNLKADAVEDIGPEGLETLSRELNLNGSSLVIVAGSTHLGEEAALLAAFEAVRAVRPDARMIIAPRRIERSGQVAALCAEMGLTVEMRTRLSGAPSVVVLDTMGELRKVYRLASIAFVGATLTSSGGHNLLEPAAAGAPVVFGPRVENTRDFAEALLRTGGGFQVSDKDDLARVLVKLAVDESLRLSAGEQARKTVRQAKGAAVRCADIVGDLISRGL
jgi:3-deoxy-D-manno-octulosonic-acid transferase